MAPAKVLSTHQIFAIEVCARTMSVLSLLGSCFIISTFICFIPFRKPINRLVFFATWGNILANVATLISTSAIPNPADRVSALCEFQGALIQWFMMADSLWVFCMATNVLLVFWYGYDAQQLRHLEKWYMLFAYGVPAIPALVYVILDHHSQTRIIGAATLWCWVAKDVDWMRIAFFYGPVWIAVSATLAIYIMTGLQIFRKRALLRPFLRPSQHSDNHRHSTDVDATADKSSVSLKDGIMVTREVQHEFHHHHLNLQALPCEVDPSSSSPYPSTQKLSNAHRLGGTQQPYQEVIHATRQSREEKRPRNIEKKKVQHSGATKDAFHTTVIATSQSRDSTTLPPRPSSGVAATHNAAAWAYLKVAFLMFAALFVVWIPSTVNRLYQFIHKDQPSYPLNIISAIVLPLQGAWNATIYIYTTRSECQRACRIIMSRFTDVSSRSQPRRELYQKDIMSGTELTQNMDAEIQLEYLPKQGEPLHCAETNTLQHQQV